jgi:hypothetical protein
MMTSMAFERTIRLAGTETAVRVTRDSSGELHLGSPDATSIVEELLVYDLGEDLEEYDRLLGELRAVGTGATAAMTRPFSGVRVELEPVVSRLRLQLPDADEPVEVATRDLHDLLAAFREFLASPAS